VITEISHDPLKQFCFFCPRQLGKHFFSVRRYVHRSLQQRINGLAPITIDDTEVFISFFRQAWGTSPRLTLPGFARSEIFRIMLFSMPRKNVGGWNCFTWVIV